MMDIKSKSCPCGNTIAYQFCCKLLHNGKQAATALQLMRSRYSAYAFGISEYIINTTHPENPSYTHKKREWQADILQFCKQTQFHKLEIINFKEEGVIASVRFKAHLSQGGKNATFCEKSTFEKIGDRWYYKDGQILAS